MLSALVFSDRPDANAAKGYKLSFLDEKNKKKEKKKKSIERKRNFLFSSFFAIRMKKRKENVTTRLKKRNPFFFSRLVFLYNRLCSSILISMLKTV